MALLGSSIDPRLFVQDYSGFTRAADIQGQSMQNLGQQVAGGIERYGEQKQQRKKLDAGIKATVTGIESAIKMGDSLGIDVKSSLTPYLEKINDPNVSPIEAAAYAQQASNSISNVLNFGMKANELGVEKERYKQATATRIAELQAEANKPGPITDVNVPGGTVQMVRNPQTGVLEPIQVAGQPPADGITSALVDGPPMDIPTTEGVIVPANEGVVSQDGTTVSYLGKQYTVDPGVLPALQTKKPAAGINGAISLTSPTSAPSVNYGVGFKATQKEKEVKVITGDQAKARNLDPAGTYEESYENGKLVGIQAITAPPSITQLAQVKKSEAEIKAAEAEVQKAQRVKDIAIKTISDYVDDEGKPTERLDKAVGYGEAFATGVAEVAPIFGTQSGETRSDQQRLNRLVETDILEAASLLKPVSNTDLLMLIKNRPTITKPTEVWTKYFSDIKQILSNPENYISSDGKSEVATPEKPLSANERLRARLNPQANR
jgi:hypothetical protein